MKIVYPLSPYINLVDTKPINRQLAPVVQKVDKAIILFVSLTLITWIVIYPVDCAIHRLNNWGLSLQQAKLRLSNTSTISPSSAGFLDVGTPINTAKENKQADYRLTLSAQ